MTRVIKSLILIALFYCCPFKMFASHYMGYDATYKRLNTDYIEVIITLYADCGHSGYVVRQQDQPMFYSLFDLKRGVQVFIDTTLKANSLPDTLSVNPLAGCTKDTQSYCVQQIVFTKRFHIRDADSFLLVNQRCCIGADNVNIRQSGEQGLTIALQLPPSGLLNSSAVFKYKPSIRQCINKPFTIDHSATDPDGDQLSYRLVQAYTGGTSTAAKPKPVPPPFIPMPYQSPATADAPFGNNGRLQINAATGMLTGICTKEGSYLITVACDETRGGKVINTTIRTFSYEMADCKGTIARIAADTAIFFTGGEDSLIAALCNQKTISFTNASKGATHYDWDFGDPNTLNDVSVLENPEYTYPGNGRYRVRLIAHGPDCSDTAYGIVLISDDEASVDFTVSGLFCLGAQLEATDNSSVTKGTVTKYTYVVENRILTGASTSFNFYRSGSQALTHYITMASGCIAGTTRSYNINKVDVLAGADTVVPVGTQLQLQATGAVNYIWTPVYTHNNLSNVMIANPVLDCRYRDESVWTVLGADGLGCYGIDTISVIVSDHAYAIVPTAFTPNNDGKNDLLRPLLSGGSLVEFRVYNRAGRVVYSTTDSRSGWDGTYNGYGQPGGVYFWMIRLKDAGQMNTLYKGDVTLIR